MCHRTERLSAIIFAALLVLGARLQSAGADDVATWLERHGLDKLLAVHLEQQLESLVGDERDELFHRLTSIYATLLESVQDPAERVYYEQKSRDLLATAPTGSADELRLALLRGTYRSASRIAENHRLRLSTAEEIQQATDGLSEIIPKLNQLGDQLERKLETAERRMARAAGANVDTLGDEVARLRSLSMQTRFLRAWALYYQSWLNDRADNARVAERIFGELLDPDSGHLEAEDVSIDLRSTEAIARSILGMALCKSLTSSTATAVSWVDLLDHERTFAPLRDEAEIWRIVVFLERGEFGSVRSILERWQSEGRQMPLPWLRLIAVHALEDGGRSVDSIEIVRRAVTELAARKDLDQVLDLASRYGVDAIGSGGFALAYVRGVLEYHEARARHDGDLPTDDVLTASLYDAAARRLTAALGESDARRYAVPASACRRLLGWCLYFQARFLDARVAFEEAATTLPADEAEEALWMAIVCVDKVVEAGDVPALEAERTELIDRFLRLYPSSPNAPRLVLKRALAAEVPSPELVSELLAIPPTSGEHDAARRRAAQLLYRLYRDAEGARRIAYGNEYLSIASALIQEDDVTVTEGDASAIERLVRRCRRVLEVGLADDVRRPNATRAALVCLDRLDAADPSLLDPWRDEIEYRRIQQSIEEGLTVEAAAIADAIWARDETSLWARLSARAVFRAARAAWRDRPEGDDREQVALVVRYGGRVLREFEDDTGALERPSVVAYYAAVAEATLTLWERSRNPENARRAHYLYKRLLERHPDNASFLRASAVLSEAVGEPDRALECWRMLLAGTAVGTQPWYEIKFRLITLLSRIDPARARQVMQQHVALNPEYGPEPWGTRLAALDERLQTEDES